MLWENPPLMSRQHLQCQSSMLRDCACCDIAQPGFAHASAHQTCVMQNGKQTRAVILPDNSAIVLYRTQDDEVYCSDANSTAYKFPMIDANVIESELLRHTPSRVIDSDAVLVAVCGCVRLYLWFDSESCPHSIQGVGFDEYVLYVQCTKGWK